MTDVRRVDPLRASQGATRGPLDARIATLAGSQGGVVSRAQLRGLGLSSGGVDARVARGTLHVVHRGVYAVGHALLLGLGHEHAALLACGVRSAISTRTAGAGWHLRAWGSRRIEVTTDSGHRSRPGILVHRHLLPREDVTVLDGRRITTVARTLFDLAEVLSDEQYTRMWEEGQRLQLIDLIALRAVAARNPGRHALAIVGPLLGAVDLAGVAQTRSPLEVDFLTFAAAYLPEFGPPVVNGVVFGFEVDIRWPQACTTVELDSRAFHDNDPAFERDRAKWAALIAAGEAVVPLTARRLRREPTLVAEQLAATLRARWRGPRPVR